MTEFRVGDRVKVEFEGVVQGVVRGGELPSKHILVSDGSTGAWVLREHATKLAPELPTKIGTVIDSHGYRFILTRNGWLATTDVHPYSAGDFKETMYARDFTVVLEGN